MLRSLKVQRGNRLAEALQISSRRGDRCCTTASDRDPDDVVLVPEGDDSAAPVLRPAFGVLDRVARRGVCEPDIDLVVGDVTRRGGSRFALEHARARGDRRGCPPLRTRGRGRRRGFLRGPTTRCEHDDEHEQHWGRTSSERLPGICWVVHRDPAAQCTEAYSGRRQRRQITVTATSAPGGYP